MCKIKGFFLTVFLLASMSFAGTANALTLDTFELDPSNSFLYGDINSFSLPILAAAYDAAFGGGVGPGNPYYITSTPGAIKDLVVIATGTSGTPVTTNFPGMDDAYSTPSGVSGSTSFATDTSDPTYTGVSDPGGAGEFLGDGENTWDSTMDAFTTFLGVTAAAQGNYPVFFFNNNEDNSGGDLDPEQNLDAWATISLFKDGDSNATLTFELSQFPLETDTTNPNFYPYPPVQQNGGIFGATPTDNPYEWESGDDPGRFVLSGGPICVDVNFIPTQCGSPADVSGIINHNLGADQAAYALISLELNALFDSGDYNDYDWLSLDITMRNLSNGYEQIFMGVYGENPKLPIPEPSTLILLACGLLGLGFIARRREKK